MKTMTFNMTSEEFEALKNMAQIKSTSKTQIMRRALRLYQFIDKKLENGGRIYFSSDDVTGCMGDD